MVYQVNVFQNWTSYNSWNDLKEWLTSEAGGLLRVVEPKDSDYALVRYTKGQSNFELAHTRWCRSVVVHKESRRPVSVAPPKSDEVTDDTVTQATIAEEFVDGTMLNVFQDGENEVRVATRSRLGADNKFYMNGPTFREMLEDALKVSQVPSMKDLLANDACEMNANSTSTFTSVVVQHASNRIVKVVGAPSFVIVHQGWVSENGTVYIEENAENFGVNSSKEDLDVEVQPYNLESVRAAKSIKDWVATQSAERGFGWQGVVLKDGQGHRWRVRSDVYETVRKLRGNESTYEERYARLRKYRSLEQYLAFFPEDRDTLYEIEGRLRKNTRQLSQLYADVFRQRSSPYHELPWPYKHHVSVLHNLFKDTLREQKKKVDLAEVIHYVNGLSMEDTVNMMKVHSMKKPAPREESTEDEKPTTSAQGYEAF